jgi:FkbM family methyltransferase
VLLRRSATRVFYDVGANYGCFCHTLADLARQIYAFEPVAHTHTVLEHNIQRNRLANVQTYRLGVSDTAQQKEIHLDNSSCTNSLFLRDTNLVDRFVGQEIVTLVRLDDLIAEQCLTLPEVSKIDIEGGELAALQGAKLTLRTYQPALVIEYQEDNFHAAGYSRDHLLAELQDAQYIVYGIPDDHMDIRTYSLAGCSDRAIANIIALPKGKEHLLETDPASGKAR